ncbi:MAG: hypothetical protein OEW84_08450 [Aigarchaeota archaeon]|nr:hypothetical protein [Aigarchaeota archaeon]
MNGARDGLIKTVKADATTDTKVAPSGLERRDPSARNMACGTTAILSMGDGSRVLETNTATPKRAIRVILCVFRRRLGFSHD